MPFRPSRLGDDLVDEVQSLGKEVVSGIEDAAAFYFNAIFGSSNPPPSHEDHGGNGGNGCRCTCTS